MKSSVPTKPVEVLNIVIAGASGYVGRALIPELLEKFPRARITALSRSSRESTDDRVEWRAADLFSTASLRAALPDRVDVAYYLVHSMGPTAALDQGCFSDYDLLLADNFAEALKGVGVRQVVYLGGLIPEGSELSLHLRSRQEVEEIFQSAGLPLVVFRAGLIVGADGSSFQILIKLVRRLPVMVCPAWTQTLTTPVDLASVRRALTAVAGDLAHVGRVYDLAGCRPIAYIDMMRETARRLGLRRYFLRVSYFTPTLSRLWVTLVTSAPRDLVYPLIESLAHTMVVRDSHQFSGEWRTRSYFDLLDDSALLRVSPRARLPYRARRKTVRSVQRMSVAPGVTAADVCASYLRWISSWFPDRLRERLLRLELDREVSTPERQVLRITGGLLVGRGNLGRFEFRSVLGGRYVIAAIHDFKPALPWFIYICTQAWIHLIVMRAFAARRGEHEKVRRTFAF